MARPSTKPQVEKRLGESLDSYLVRRYIKDGLSIVKLAHELRVSTPTVGRWLREAKLPIRKQIYTFVREEPAPYIP